MQTQITPFFHEATSSWTYLVRDPSSDAAVVIDPVLDFDLPSGEVAAVSAAGVLAEIRRTGARVHWILETHAHADHLTAAAWLRRHTGARLAIGAGIVEVQRTFKEKLDLSDDELVADGRPFDALLHDGQVLDAGGLSVLVIGTPGHTSDSVTYVIGEAAFIGDTMFSPGAGTARCDFPGGNAQALYRSIHRIFELPVTQLYLAHDYPPAGTPPTAAVTVAEQRRGNIHVHDGIDEAGFIGMRTQRDARLPPPRLLWPALQVNIRGGELPPPAVGGRRYFKLPLRLADDIGDSAP